MLTVKNESFCVVQIQTSPSDGSAKTAKTHCSFFNGDSRPFYRDEQYRYLTVYFCYNVYE